jgi:hypothetical protein
LHFAPEQSERVSRKWAGLGLGLPAPCRRHKYIVAKKFPFPYTESPIPCLTNLCYIQTTRPRETFHAVE